MGIYILRWAVFLLAMLVSGGVLLTLARYLRATWRNHRRAPGRILARHVSEVSGGTLMITVGFAWAMLAQLDGTQYGATARLWLYLIGMTLLLIGLFDVANYQRAVGRYAAPEGATT